MLIGQLVNLKFIKSQPDGELHTASEYFDVENRTFQLMLDRDQFPPEPYDNYRWVCVIHCLYYIYICMLY